MIRKGITNAPANTEKNIDYIDEFCTKTETPIIILREAKNKT